MEIFWKETSRECSGNLFRRLCIAGVAVALLLPPLSVPAATRNVPQTTVAGNINANYLYNLSNFGGVIPYGWVKVFTENTENEIYVMAGNLVTIFSRSGMEIYKFGFDQRYGNIYDATVDADGTMILLSYEGWKYWLTLCNFRGEPIARIEPKNFPPMLSEFSPNRIIKKNERLYLVNYNRMRVVVTDLDGSYVDNFDLAGILEFTEEQREDTGITSFNIDGDGNFLFTVPVTAGAYIVTPDRKVTKFGKRGSAPGRFGIPSEMVRDHRGNYLVVDTLKCVVLVFDKNLNFLMEFGYRGPAPGNLIAPQGLAVDSDGRLYVVQTAKRGVSVYQLTYE